MGANQSIVNDSLLSWRTAAGRLTKTSPLLVAPIILLIALFSTPSAIFALSDTQYKALLDQSPEYRQAEKELNAVWKRLMKELSPAQAQEVRQEQRRWVLEERDGLAKELMDREGLSQAEAYARVTSGRISRLREYLNEKPATKGPAGRYEDGAGYLVVQELGGGRFQFELYTDWPPQHCSGWIEKAEITIENGRAVFSDSECPDLTFTFGPDEVEIEEQEFCGYHGLNCRFDGVYVRVD